MKIQIQDRCPPVTIVLVLLGLLWSAAVMAAETVAEPPASDAAPAVVVEALERGLIAAMRAGKTMDFAARSDFLRPLIERTLDIPRMGRFIFAAHWRTFDEPAQQQFIAAFTRLSVANYADHFDQYKGERFEAVTVEQPDETRARVRHRLIKGSGEAVAFDYLLFNNNGEWRIINIITDGVSDLALKRSQYGTLYDQGGLPAVIEEIEAQSRKLAHE